MRAAGDPRVGKIGEHEGGSSICKSGRENGREKEGYRAIRIAGERRPTVAETSGTMI